MDGGPRGGWAGFPDVPEAADSDSTPRPQTQIRSKPWAKGLQSVFTKRLQRAGGTASHSLGDTFPAISEMEMRY